MKFNIHPKIDSESILFFDMDGTLIDTDYANFLSYKNSIQTAISIDKKIEYNSKVRFNRTSLKTVFPDLTTNEYEKIIQDKEKNFSKHLSHTTLKSAAVDILNQYSITNKTVLVTNCREDRALLTLDFHNLTNKFNNLFFRQSIKNGNHINKYQHAITTLNVSVNKIIVFENEIREIDDALKTGIPIKNIIKF
ncbi:HAD hydrolase-like protein [Labilibacter marinus]|uniref:HAD hydrolase-like protein n=1 Tax=Labilibacter marinus TaxID=1477105 RepID=UPI00094F8DD5|nr:HAD hydrolase-like protein [Labilibacter marinus]